MILSEHSQATECNIQTTVGKNLHYFYFLSFLIKKKGFLDTSSITGKSLWIREQSKVASSTLCHSLLFAFMFDSDYTLKWLQSCYTHAIWDDTKYIHDLRLCKHTIFMSHNVHLLHGCMSLLVLWSHSQWMPKQQRYRHFLSCWAKATKWFSIRKFICDLNMYLIILGNVLPAHAARTFLP